MPGAREDPLVGRTANRKSSRLWLIELSFVRQLLQWRCVTPACSALRTRPEVTRYAVFFLYFGFTYPVGILLGLSGTHSVALLPPSSLPLEFPSPWAFWSRVVN